MIKCIIVEDETLAQNVLENYLRKTVHCELVATCSNALEARQALDTLDVDLMFLDIQLPGMTGLNFLRTLPSPPLVIITTAYAEYAVESYEFTVIDYLLKPVSYDRFCKAVNKVIEGKLFTETTRKEQHAADHIFIKSNSKFFKVNFPEIIYIESMKDYLKIYTHEYRLVTHQTMNEMEKILPAAQFIRAHKSFIAGVGHIKSIYGNSIEVEGKTIPIGNNYKTNVMRLVNKKYLR